MNLMNKFVMGMVSIRLLSGCIEIIAALIMLRLNRVDHALLINSGLALVGPIILIATTAIGLIGMADKLSWDRLVWVFIGISFLFVGVLKN